MAIQVRSLGQSGFEIARHATHERSKTYDLKTAGLKSGGPEKNGRQRTEQARRRANAVFRSAKKPCECWPFSRGEEAQRIFIKKELVAGEGFEPSTFRL
jgi:hypothetical protein